jgi:hypothetical protein
MDGNNLKSALAASLVSSPLAELADQINREHAAVEAGLRASLHHAVLVGQLLIEAKRQIEHGNWGQWVGANCHFSEKTAQNYMRVARSLPALQAKSATVADLSLRDALALLAVPTSFPKPLEVSPPGQGG